MARLTRESLLEFQSWTQQSRKIKVHPEGLMQELQ
jgi:hypothetical protein